MWTDARRKQSGFGKIKMMLQRDLLVLPREPELLKQLRALEFEQMPGGSVKIAVPERAGHDDLAMALMQAVSCVRPAPRGPDEIWPRPELAHTVTASGIRVPDVAPAGGVACRVVLRPLRAAARLGRLVRQAARP